MIGRSRSRREISLRTREALHGYGFILIWIVGFLLFTLLPLSETFHYSLNQVSVTATHINLDFVEWANYSRALFTDPNFVELLVGYTVETLVSVPIVLIFAMSIALFLNLKFRLKGLFRVIFFLPIVITSGPVIKELTAQGAASAPGIANIPAVVDFLAQLPRALRSPVEYLLTSFILILWFSGVQILIYLASLQKIDRSIYEAAAIDGASSWEIFWKIILPSLSMATLLNAIYTIVTLSHFSENRVIRYIYNQTYDVRGGIGYASAMAFIYFGVMIILLAAVYFFLMQWAKRESK
ncbi:MAG: sugar ABC transporter permease [Chloroflexi bacterium]|jgi:ABC-type sugar transport system permease subunit|nr:sugar ABC transporter permease [Chloroflexota bacterium]MDL1882652.1 sugar ABC transporter permease [Anaerolineae bacterium CFX8]